MSAVQSNNQHLQSIIPQQNLSLSNVSPSYCSLYIGELHSDVNEAALYQFIAQAGVSITSARVCRSTSTKKSLNYGYLNFQSKEDADKAMDKLNYTNLMGKPVRMMLYQRDPSLRKSSKGNIIIKNLHKSIHPRILLDIMKKIGNVLSLSMKPDNEGQTQNAYIQFEDPDHAETAVRALDKTHLSNILIEVKHFKPQKEQFEIRDMREETFVNCYVKNLPKDKFKTNEDLREYFSSVGEITSCKLVHDLSGTPTGAGFVCFANHESAVKACKEFDGKEIDPTPGAKALIFSRFMRKNERFQMLKDKFDGMKVDKRPNNNVYIKNLDSTITDETLGKEFSQFGPIISAKVMTHANGQSRGFGFVSFENPKDAATAIEKKHNTYYFSKPLHCEWAQKKDERQLSLRNQFRISPQYFVGPHTMPYMMRQPGSFFAQPNYMHSPHQQYPGGMFNNGGGQMPRHKQNYQQGNFQRGNQQNHYGNQNQHQGNSQNGFGNDKTEMYRSMKQQNNRGQQNHQQQAQHHQPQQQQTATPLSHNQKNNFGQEFMEMIRKINNPDLIAKSGKVIGIFLDAGFEHCKNLLENPEVFKHSCERLLVELNDKQQFGQQ